MQCAIVKNRNLEKEQGASRLLSRLVIKARLSKIHLVDPLLF